MNALLTLLAIVLLVFCGRAAFAYWRSRATLRADAARRNMLKASGRRVLVTPDNCYVQDDRYSCHLIFREGDTRYISSSLRAAADSVRYLVRNNQVCLYVDPGNARNYCFDVQA